MQALLTNQASKRRTCDPTLIVRQRVRSGGSIIHWPIQVLILQACVLKTKIKVFLCKSTSPVRSDKWSSLGGRLNGFSLHGLNGCKLWLAIADSSYELLSYKLPTWQCQVMNSKLGFANRRSRVEPFHLARSAGWLAAV